jgi:hypothetical protein
MKRMLAEESQPDQTVPHPVVLMVALLGVLLLAVYLRWQYVVQMQPYPDEFVTMLAVQGTAETGAPVLPSGLFYEHGLLFSYVAAGVTLLAGFSREVVRSVSLVLSLLTVVLTWHVGRRWFGGRVGLWAAALLAVAPTAVMWGGRARMYALLQFWVLLAVGLLLSGVMHNRPLRRWLALAAYLGAVLTQFVSVTLAPPLVLASLGLGWLRHASGAVTMGSSSETAESSSFREGPIWRLWLLRPAVWLEGLGWLLVVVAAFLLKRAGQPKGIAPLEASAGGVVHGIGQVLSIYGALPTALGESWRAIAPFYTASGALVLTTLMGIAVLWALVRLALGARQPRDLAAVFLAGVLLVTTVEMVMLVSAERRDDKYMFMLLPLLCLLAADGLARLVELLIERLEGSWQSWASVGFTLLGAVAAAALFWTPTQALLADRGEDYDTAFDYVKDHWLEGDRILTGTPAAAAIYLGRNDYYAVRGTEGYAYRILEKDGQLVDRWMGSPWLETAEDLHRVLSSSDRVWLVLERWGLVKEYYSPLMMQQMLAMTDFVREDNGIIVLQSRSGTELLPQEPTQSLAVDFDGRLRLVGTTVQEEASRRIALDFYWQAQTQLDYDYSVFVHLRDEQGNTVAQSDHLPLAPVFPPTLWPPGEVVRERSLLQVPDEAPPGSYALWLGVYRLDTLERLPIVGDMSGESAAMVGTVVVE